MGCCKSEEQVYYVYQLLHQCKWLIILKHTFINGSDRINSPDVICNIFLEIIRVSM